ncbi:MAG: 50S ribosomal protein L6 [Mycoplasmataceae bacterium]|jgi:large subunit ribosomal protein L6|nr:50S ribosomal protein L6 [Mycoplasmataceae bacterium]
MSRKGIKAIKIPAGTTVSANNGIIDVKGNLGSLQVKYPSFINIVVNGDSVKVERTKDDKEGKTFHGTVASNLMNAIHGVTLGYTKKLKIVGVGYKAILGGKTIAIHAGFSGFGAKEVSIPANLKVTVPAPQEIVINGFDKELVGQFAASIRSIRKPEPYNGKGIMYDNEIIVRKVGKTAEGTKK